MEARESNLQLTARRIREAVPPLGHLRTEAIWARRTPDRREEVGAPDGSVSLYLLCCGVRFRGGEVFEADAIWDLDLYGLC